MSDTSGSGRVPPLAWGEQDSDPRDPEDVSLRASSLVPGDPDSDTRGAEGVRVPPLAPGERYHAFISHCTADLDYSLALRDKLIQAGFKCFHSDEDFTPGETIVKNIMSGIDRSRRVIGIISPDMMKSKWVEFEVANTRAKANQTKVSTFIPILHNIHPDRVPAYVKEINYITDDDPSFWTKLLRALVDEVPLTATIPAGHIAHGLSWSFFYGYLAFVLPKLTHRARQSTFGELSNFLQKMIIILPESCYCPDDVTSVDSNVEEIGSVDFRASRAGKKNRDYNSLVYKVTDPSSGEELYAMMEYATPLMSMYEMEQGRIANLDRLEKIRQMELFKEKIEEILRHPNNAACHGKAVLITYRDEADNDQEPERFSAVIARRIRAELQKVRLDEAMEH